MSLPDRLPPHSLEAEAGVLGCVLISPTEALAEAVRRIRQPEWFYDQRHRKLWEVLVNMHTEGMPIDMLTVQQRLKDGGNIQAAGGVAYISSLPDLVPSAANLPHYLSILAEKANARRLVAACGKAVVGIYNFEGSLSRQSEILETELAEIKQQWRDPQAKPDRILSPADVAEDIDRLWFGKGETKDIGLHLPWEFIFNVREGEMTFVLGEKGMGKSTLLSYILLHLAHQGWPIFVASMETRPEQTLSIMLMQLLGRNKLPRNPDGTATPESRAIFDRGLAWLNKRVRIYNFMGIADWRHILQTMDWEVKHEGVKGYLIDSVMRLGIPDEELSEQGVAARSFANFCETNRVHLFIVNHLNKSDRDTKKRSRGSQQWLDNAHNILSIERNEKKWEKLTTSIEKLDASLRNRKIPHDEYVKSRDDLWDSFSKEWDSKLVLHNQRFPWAEHQNGSIHLWFRVESRQLHKKLEGKKPEEMTVYHIDKWAPAPNQSHVPHGTAEEPVTTQDTIL